MSLTTPQSPIIMPGRGQLTHSEFVQRLNQLRELAGQANNDAEARMVTSRIAQLSRMYRIQSGVGLPTNPIAQAQEIDPRYVSRPHLELLSDRFTAAVRDVERGQNRFLAVSMPPRSGKSTLVSLFGPTWLLRRHPDWKVVMTSFDGGLVTGWARSIRQVIETNPTLGIALQPDGGAGARWQTIEGGGMYATGIGGPLTGRGARVMIIDDPVSDFVAAHSLNKREALWNWWLSVARTRLEDPYLVFVVMCMTGDTPVLRPDGTETPLRDIRPGDEIATFTDDGEVTTSVVSNWANQGPDDIFALSMASGRVVRANARHPFWVIDEDGEGSWVRLGSLQVGMKVRCLTEPTEELSAQSMTATSHRSARACACRTTTRLDGQPGSALPRTTPSQPEPFGSVSVTGSRSMITLPSSKRRVDVAPSVEGSLRKSTSRSTGPMSSALTTATTPELCEVCSATIATSSLLAATRLTSCDGPLSTWAVSTDEIVSIEPVGREDVFDVEVVGTHRFIANRLDAANTRWHEDDFVGRLLSPDHEGDPADWERVVMPAIADSPDDPLGREIGQPLYSPLREETEEMALDRWSRTREAVGSYTWAAMYQQRPAPQKGAIFDVGWWRYWTTDPDKVTDDGRVVFFDADQITAGGRWLDSWDCSFKGGSSTDYVVGQRWVRLGANRYLVASQRGRWNFTQTITRMENWNVIDNHALSPFGRYVHEHHIEDTANGPAIINVLQQKISGLKAIRPRTSKEARARAVTPEIESGNVYLPNPSDPGNEWVNDLLSELRNFPHDVHDDQVDALTQALLGLRDEGRGGITVPGATGLRPDWRQTGIQRNIAQAARSDMGRPRGAMGQRRIIR